MKHSNINRLFTLLVCTIMTLSYNCPVQPKTVIAASKTAEHPTYIALGDSITLGTGLAKNEDNFSTILHSYLKEQTPELSLINYGKNGDTIKDITKKTKTKEVKNNLKNATLVTLTAGGNDILQLTAAAAEKYTGKDFKKTNSIPAFVKNETTARLLLSYLKKDSVQKELAVFLEEFETNFRTLVQTIKESSPNATIVVQTIYNPASGSEYVALSQCIDIVLPKTNEIIKKIVREENAKQKISKQNLSKPKSSEQKNAEHNNMDQKERILLLDTNKLFDNQAPLYVRVNEDDIHPTEAGHRLIANQIMIMLENQKALLEEKQRTHLLRNKTKHVSTPEVRSINSDYYRTRALTFISIGFFIGLGILCLATIIGELYTPKRKRIMKDYDEDDFE